MLKEYAKKRHFEATPEPGPEAAPPSEGALSFVVQKHAATRLHYDVRLELDGALVSWAVPKGPSLNPHDKRLAVKVEDHPLDYASFEGIIPEGNYGGGEVIVWDRGTYRPLKGAWKSPTEQDEVRRELEEGQLEVILEGAKLRGAFVFIRTRGKEWLLIKMADEFVSTEDILKRDESVVTGHRIGGVPDARRTVKAETLPTVEPMVPTETDKAFSDPRWSFELKLDGIRVLVYLNPGKVRLISRNGNDVTSRFPQLVKELSELEVTNSVLDGEVVAFDSEGRPNFQTLLGPFQSGTVKDAQLCVFDAPYLDGHDLRRKPWSERRKKLEGARVSGEHVRVMDVFPTEGELLYEKATEMGFEGVVGKRTDSTYDAGRSPKWVKVKSYHSEEFIVAGYLPGKGGRSKSFGSLVLGERTDKGLSFAGNVGGGFTDSQVDRIRAELDQIQTPAPPLIDPPNEKGAVWVEPRMVVEVRYTNRTNDGRLRFPVFLRERPDLEPPQGSMKPSPTQVDEILRALSGPEKEMQLAVEGHELRFTNLDKELWPGTTKRNLIVYYATVSETLLHHLNDRPLSFVRCPDGIAGERFFQKHWDQKRPDFVEAAPIYSGANGRVRDFVMCNNLATLLWLGQLAAVELNPWMSRTGGPGEVEKASTKDGLEESLLDRPDFLVFDLDPHFGGKATGWKKPEWDMLVEVAYELNPILQSLGLQGRAKSSGKSGLHVFVPILPDHSYDEVRSAAATIGNAVKSKLGQKVTLEWNIKTRPNGVFIDVNQNVRGKTMAAPYSPRAAAGPWVSVPLLWEELHRADPTKWTVATVPDRLRKKGDFWADILDVRRPLIA